MAPGALIWPFLSAHGCRQSIGFSPALPPDTADLGAPLPGGQVWVLYALGDGGFPRARREGSVALTSRLGAPTFEPTWHRSQPPCFLSSQG